MLRHTSDSAERSRLETMFKLERKRAAETLQQLERDNEAELASAMEDLGMFDV